MDLTTGTDMHLDSPDAPSWAGTLNTPGRPSTIGLESVKMMASQLTAVSAMTDNKARVMITVSSVVLTLTPAGWSREELRPSIVVLLACALPAFVAAVLTVMPGMYRRPANGKGNPLFFGHVASLSMEEYLVALHAVIDRDDTAIDAWGRDLWTQSHYLIRKKFAFLRFGFLALIAGFTGAVVAFAATTLT